MAAAPDPLQATRMWLERAVIGLNLCPFAKAVHHKGLIRWVLSEATEPGELLALLEAEMQHLLRTDAQQTDTTLIVHPGVLQDFFDFNDFLGLAEDRLAELGLDGVLQIASFHPDYQFADAAPDAVDNLSNRSPYPTLHLLREDSVSRAVDAYPETDSIYEDNIRTLRRLGHEGWLRWMQGPPD